VILASNVATLNVGSIDVSLYKFASNCAVPLINVIGINRYT